MAASVNPKGASYPKPALPFEWPGHEGRKRKAVAYRFVTRLVMQGGVHTAAHTATHPAAAAHPDAAHPAAAHPAAAAHATAHAIAAAHTTAKSQERDLGREPVRGDR